MLDFELMVDICFWVVENLGEVVADLTAIGAGAGGDRAGVHVHDVSGEREEFGKESFARVVLECFRVLSRVWTRVGIVRVYHVSSFYSN